MATLDENLIVTSWGTNSEDRRYLTLCEDGKQGIFKVFFGQLHLLLMLGFLAH